MADWTPARGLVLDKKGKVSIGEFLSTPQGKFLDELTSTGSVQYKLRASYLGSQFRFSKPITLQCPMIEESSWRFEGADLHVSVTVQQFSDKLLYLRVYQRSKKAFLPGVGGQEWSGCELNGRDPHTGKGFFLLDGSLYASVDPADLFVCISLIPHEAGLLNRRQAPPGLFDQSQVLPSSPAEVKAEIRSAVSDRLAIPSVPGF